MVFPYMNAPANIPHDGRVYHLKTPNYPQFRFEWHAGVKRVYIIRLGVEPLIGEPFAFNIETEGDAWNAALMFLRGYRAAAIFLPPKNGENT